MFLSRNIATGINTNLWMGAALSGLLQVVIFPSPAIAWLSWVAIVPLLWALLRTPVIRRLHGFLLGYLAGVIWYAGSCYWVFHVMHTFGGLHPLVAAGVLLLFCMYLGLYLGLFGLLVVSVARRAGTFRALMASPFLWVAVELARARITGFPWDLLGTAQVDNIPLTRIATWTGVYGLSFVIVAVNVLITYACISEGKKRLAFAAAGLGVAALLQAGAWIHLPDFPVTHTATLVQQNIPILQEGGWTADVFDQALAEVANLSRTSASRESPSPRLIIWPESPAPFFTNDPKLRSWLATLAEDRDAYVIAGSLGVTRRGGDDGSYEMFNSAALIAPTGALVSRYDKIHLVPFGEYIPFKALLVFAQKLTREVGDFSRGTSRNPFLLSSANSQSHAHTHNHDPGALNGHLEEASPPQGRERKIAVFICYESIFPDEIREFAAHGAEVFVNISNDGWFGPSGAPGQHLNMARMRAIENHRWVLRSTNTGITASIDPYGRVVSRAATNRRTSLQASYSYIAGTTFYTRHGDWFAWGCAIISLLALFARLRVGTIQ